MVNFKNANYPTFLTETIGKRVILFGTGGTFRDFLANNAEKLSLLEAIDVILDNDENKLGQEVYLPIKTLKIKSINGYLQSKPDLSNYVILLLIAERYALDVVRQLDAFSQFEGISCYYGITSLTWGRESYPPLPVNAQLPKLKGEYTIPKVIHYIWFGREPMGELIKYCIESWNRYCPDYELKLWNEENYDLSKAPSYVKQAYEAKKYAFVSDYVRLDVVHRYGGFYLDTDVELLESLDVFLSYPAIFGYETNNLIATGLCFGAIKGDEILNGLLHIYEKLIFSYSDGTYNERACPYFHTNYLREFGLEPNNQTRMFNKQLLLSSNWLSPINTDTNLLELCDYTVAVHYFNCSWFDPKMSILLKAEQDKKKNINMRLLTDWKRRKVRQL